MSDEYIKKDDVIAYCNKKANYYADKAERYKKYQKDGSYFDLANRIQSYETEATFYSSFSEELESLPTADVVEPKRGEWIEHEGGAIVGDNNFITSILTAEQG